MPAGLRPASRLNQKLADSGIPPDSSQFQNALAYTFLVLQLAELTTPDFDPKPYLTDNGRAVYDMGSESCLRAMEDAIEKGQVSGKVGFAQPVTAVVESLFPLI